MKAACNFTFALCRNTLKHQVGRVSPDMGSYTWIQWENKWVIQTGVLVAVLFCREAGAESSFLRAQVLNSWGRPIWSDSPPGPFQPAPWPKGSRAPGFPQICRPKCLHLSMQLLPACFRLWKENTVLGTAEGFQSVPLCVLKGSAQPAQPSNCELVQPDSYTMTVMHEVLTVPTGSPGMFFAVLENAECQPACRDRKFN